MLQELERIVGKVTNAPRPILPEDMFEEAPLEDSPEMLLGETDTVFLPAGVIVEYSDDLDQESVRRVTLLSAKPDGDDPSFTAYCHTRRDIRRFRFARPLTIIDPVTEEPYSSPNAFLERFRCDRTPQCQVSPLCKVLCAVRDELSMLMFFSRCDGYLHPAERSVVLSFIRETNPGAEYSDDEIWEIVQRLYPDSLTMLNSARRLDASKGPEALSAIQKTIRTLIEADGVIHSDEALHAIELSFLKPD